MLRSWRCRRIATGSASDGSPGTDRYRIWRRTYSPDRCAIVKTRTKGCGEQLSRLMSAPGRRPCSRFPSSSAHGPNDSPSIAPPQPKPPAAPGKGECGFTHAVEVGRNRYLVGYGAEREGPIKVLVIGGPNGAGKTTFATEYLPLMGPAVPFVNCDAIAAQLNPDAPDAAAQEAGRIALRRMESYAVQRRDFAFETTLSGRAYVRRLIKWRERGYRIGMVYLRLPSADHVVRRVAQRVSEGGHDIPEPVARRRFERSWSNFVELYRPVADEWQVYDTSGRPPTIVATSERTDMLPEPRGWRVREVPAATDAGVREGSGRPDYSTRRCAMTKEATRPADRFPEGEPSVENVMTALRQAREVALARAEAVRQRQAEAGHAEKVSSALEG